MNMCLQAELVPGGVRLRDAPHPGEPGPGELLVAMRRAPINPADLLMVDGRYSFQPTEIAVAGAEGVGEVIAVGPDVAGVAPGEHVIPLARGNWARLRRVRAEEVIPVPARLPLEQAAMLRINPATAWRLLNTRPLGRGDVVVQNGGRSAVAMLVERIAAKRGIEVVTVSRHADAAAPLLPDGEDLPARLRARTGGRGARLALDCVAGEASGRLAACLEGDGRLVVFGHLSGDPCRIPSALFTGGGLVASGFSLRPAEAGETLADRQSLYARLADMLADAPLPVAATLPLSRLDDAVAAARVGDGRIQLDLTG